MSESTFNYSGSEIKPFEGLFSSTEVITGGTVSAIEPGDYVATFAPDKNHCWPDGSITVKEVPWSIEGALSSKDMTAEQFNSAIVSGKGSVLFAVGDLISVPVNGTVGQLSLEDKCYAQILGFNHNQPTEGTGNYVDVQFAVSSEDSMTHIAYCDHIYGPMASTSTAPVGFQMVLWADTKYGYNDSSMCQNICPQFYNIIDSSWKDIIIPAFKYSDNLGKNTNVPTNITGYNYFIWLLSHFEVFGEVGANINQAEATYQTQYNLYDNGITLTRKRYNDISTLNWWLRSKFTNSNNYNIISSSGLSSGQSPSVSQGFSPCMRIGAA